MLLKKITSILLAIVFMAGASLEVQAADHNILGLWKITSVKDADNNSTEQKIVNNTDNRHHVYDAYYYFADNGVFALLNQTTRTGISWEFSENDVLTMVSSPLSTARSLPVNSAHEEIFKLITLKKNQMVLQNTHAEHVTFEKMEDTVFHISGKMMYRERMALPPLVETQVQLYANGKPLAINFVQNKGQIPLPFSVYFLKQKKETQITLDASIYHEYNKLFGTIEPIVVTSEYVANNSEKKGTEQKKLDVLLYRSIAPNNEIKTIIYPSTYKSKNDEYTLYLEAEGFGILKDKKNAETIHWAQVDRNHKLEIIRGGKEPLFVSVKPKNELVFEQLKGKDSVIFSHVNEKFSKEILSIAGTYTEIGSKGYFTDCNSQKQFVLDFAKNPKLHKTYLDLGAHAGLATLEVIISRDNNELALNIKNFKSLEKDKKCQSVFQNAKLSNAYWRLVTLNGKPVEKYQDQTEPHFTIRGNQATGSDGCNNFFMPVTINDNNLKFGIGGSTLMLCPQGDAQSREFLQSLNKVETWKINGSTLQLKKDDEIKLTFEVVYF